MITKMGMPFEGLAKSGFTGSYKGMRFLVKSYEEGKITAYIYPEPYIFSKTPEEKKESMNFNYTKEGVDECVNWLNQMYIEKKEMWDKAYESRNDAVVE